MAINDQFATQIRQLLIQHLPDGVAVDDITEKKMFGGLAFMLKGKMCVAIGGRDGCEVMLRIGKANHDAALQHKLQAFRTRQTEAARAMTLPPGP